MGLLCFIVSGLLCLWEKSVIIVDKVTKYDLRGLYLDNEAGSVGLWTVYALYLSGSAVS